MFPVLVGIGENRFPNVNYDMDSRIKVGGTRRTLREGFNEPFGRSRVFTKTAYTL